MDDLTIISEGKTAIGIELGSTRVKAVLVDENARLLAMGSAGWENSFEDGLWTYPLEKAVMILQECFADLLKSVREKYGIELKTAGALGISAMMHGYIALDENDRQLYPFLTWRNVNTGAAAAKMTRELGSNIPLRWSTAHLYQAVLEKREHVNRIKYMCTLSSYIHLLLSGERVVGIGDASGMFPIDPDTLDFDKQKLQTFERMLRDENCSLKMREILPKVLTAGRPAGKLTKKGALILDPSGTFCAGVPMVPPEGDAGTGMTATNAVSERTGNISAGTSVFSMTVLEHSLSRSYPNVDIVMTPDGKEVAMIQCNNGTPDLDAWMHLAKEAVESLGFSVSDDRLYETFFMKSLEAAPDAGGIISINYLAGEHVTGIEHGHPMLIRSPGSDFSLANLSRAMIYGMFASLSIGMRVLLNEGVRLDRMTGHGGLFKTAKVAQKYLSAAVGTPIGVMRTAGEGGAFGMAMLALFLKNALKGEKLPDYLDSLFARQDTVIIEAGPLEKEGFKKYLSAYEMAIEAEKSIETN